jgi:hypothetical protein
MWKQQDKKNYLVFLATILFFMAYNDVTISEGTRWTVRLLVKN